MLDKYTMPLASRMLSRGAQWLHQAGISANAISTAGFLIGMTAVVFLANNYYSLALIALLINRLCDGLDGMVARISVQQQASIATGTHAGGFLDICYDFVFYASIPLGFALADSANAVAAALLLFSFVGTTSSFLAFATIAAKLNLKSTTYPNKAFYYLEGITEGTETFLFFVLMCLLPSYFVPLALIFALLCMITTATRIYVGYSQFRYTNPSSE